MDRLIWFVGTYPAMAPVLAERVKVELPKGVKFVLEKHELNFDDISFVLTRARSNATFQALIGFNEVYPASNHQIYQAGDGSRFMKCNVA